MDPYLPEGFDPNVSAAGSLDIVGASTDLETVNPQPNSKQTPSAPSAPASQSTTGAKKPAKQEKGHGNRKPGKKAKRIQLGPPNRPEFPRKNWSQVREKAVSGSLEVDLKTGVPLIIGKNAVFVPASNKHPIILIKPSVLSILPTPLPTTPLKAIAASWPKWSKYPFGRILPTYGEATKAKESEGKNVKSSKMGDQSQPVHTEGNEGKSNKGKDHKTKDRKERNGKRRTYFEEYLDAKTVESELKAGTLIKGEIRVNRKNNEMAYVTRKGDGVRDVLIQDFKDRNRAINGDCVAIRIHPKSKWKLRGGGGGRSGRNNKRTSNEKKTPEPVTGRTLRIHDALHRIVIGKFHGPSSSAPITPGLEVIFANGSKGRIIKKWASGGKFQILMERDPAPGTDVDREFKKGKPQPKLLPGSGLSTFKLPSPGPIPTPTPKNDSNPSRSRVESEGGDISEAQPTGKVVAIVESNHSKNVTGYLKPLAHNGRVQPRDKVCKLVPLDRRLPLCFVGRERWPVHFIANHPEIEAHRLEMEAERAAKRAEKNNSETNKTDKAKNGEPSKKEGEVGARWEKGGTASGVDDARMIYVGRIQKWQPHQRIPYAVVTKTIGMTGDIEAETEALLCECEVDYDFDGQFSDKVLLSLKPYMENPLAPTADSTWAIPESEVKSRLDLRHKRITTIDPTTARDLDDALSIDDLGNNKYRIGVHIADVSHFVSPGSELDKEARKRCTTIYLVQKSLPMLPRVLSENLCSLAPKVDRLAYSCFFTMDGDGQLMDTPAPWFGKTIIRTVCQLDYQTAQKLVDEKPEDIVDHKDFYERLDMPDRMIPIEGVSLRDVTSDLRLFDKIAKKRRQHRFKTGSLGLNRGKILFSLDENNLPVEFFSYVSRGSNKLIEEYMLLANMLVAEKILDTFPNAALLRQHAPPDKRQLQNLIQFMTEMGFPMKGGSAGALHEALLALDNVQTDSGVNIRSVAELLLTKPMQQALYVCSGEKKRKELRHYALNFNAYTHFTSPIRRYVDVIVHRLLTQAIKSSPNPSFTTKDSPSNPGYLKAKEGGGTGGGHVYGSKQVEEIADRCNKRKENSKKAQEISSRVFLSVCLKAQPVVKEATIIDMGYKSFYVMVGDMGIDQQVYVQDIKAKAAFVVNEKGERVTKDNESETKKPNRSLHIQWDEESKVERIPIFGRVSLLLTAKTTPPIDIKACVVRPGTLPPGWAGQEGAKAKPAKVRTGNDPKMFADE